MYMTNVRYFSGISGSRSVLRIFCDVRTCRHFRHVAPKKEEKLKLSDNIPKEYQIIYRAPMISHVYFAQSVSTCSILALSTAYLYNVFSYGTLTFPIVLMPNSEIMGDVITDATAWTILITSFMLFNIGIYAVTMRFPLRIYYNEVNTSYIGIFTSLLPYYKRQLSFKKGDTLRAYSILSAVLPWRDTIFKIGNRTVFIFENRFRTPADFNAMLRKL